MTDLTGSEGCTLRMNGLIVARLLYIFLAAKAVAMVLDGMDDFLIRFFHDLPVSPLSCVAP